MSVSMGPGLPSNGLLFYYNMKNGRSFVGGPTTNVLPSPSINGYPTFGNGWGTYNTNQYNSNTYFSIGTIASVSGNTVNTTAAHPLRSYDVVTPQSSGGGLTAGVNYTVKKLSSTSFSLYAYNGSQDGSQGYINPATGNHKVYDDYSNDVRVSVNATSFPTMWWGPPHLPNSGLVKEIISSGFNGIVGKTATDCIRCHWNRLDGVTDGMAYGVDAPVVAGQPYTLSFWTRAVTTSAVGQSLSYQIYNYNGAVSPAGYSFNAVIGAVGVWTRQSITFTPVNSLCISYWFPSTGNMKVDIANIQFETGSIANNFTTGTRSTTQVIADLTNNTTPTATSLTYASDGTFSFNGSSNYIDVTTNLGVLSAYTIFHWSRRDAESKMPIGWRAGPVFYQYGDNSWFYTHGGVSAEYYYPRAVSIPVGTYGFYCITYDGSNVKIYRNGVFEGQQATTGTADWTNGIRIGYWAGGSAYYYQGVISSVGMYNRSLSADEVNQHFSAFRGQFGI